ncbi:MAG: response regulator [Luteitalea sp.]|nr:response regulator [Luteitalea sp.]
MPDQAPDQVPDQAPGTEPLPRAVPRIRVAIVEDQREIRESLATLLDSTPEFHCSGAYRSMEAALGPLLSDRPQVALLDIGLPGMSGIDGVRRLAAIAPKILCVMLTVYEDDARIFEALCAGACGYLLKKTPPPQILDALNDAVAGGAPMSPDVASRVITLFRAVRPPAQADYNLTPHEIRVLRLFADGYNYKTAATELGVTVHTISFHLRRIYEKLQVHSKTEAVAKALHHRLLR